MSSTCELSTISDPPPISNSFAHLWCFFSLKHLGPVFFPIFTLPFATSSAVKGLGFVLLLMTKLTSINSPLSPLLQSLSELSPQNFQFSIYQNENQKQKKELNWHFLHKFEKIVFGPHRITQNNKAKTKGYDRENLIALTSAPIGLSGKRSHPRMVNARHLVFVDFFALAPFCAWSDYREAVRVGTLATQTNVHFSSAFK